MRRLTSGSFPEGSPQRGILRGLVCSAPEPGFFHVIPIMKGCLAVGVADGVVGRVVGGMDPNKGSIFFGDGAIDINVGWGPISYVKIFKVIQNAMFGGMGVAADHS